MQNANKQIGQAIREVRIRRKLNQTQLGDKIGKSVKTISAYEIGRIEVPFSVLRKIAAVFGVSISRLAPTSDDNVTGRK